MPRKGGRIMRRNPAFLFGPAVVLAALLFLREPQPGDAYIGGPPLSLGMMCFWSTHVAIARIDALDRTKGVIIFRKVRDVKGKWPADVFRHAYPVGFPNRAYVL